MLYRICLSLLIACTACEGRDAPPLVAPTIRVVDSATYHDATQFALVGGTDTCGDGSARRCPSDEIVLGTGAADGDVLVFTETRNAFVYPSGNRLPIQAVFAAGPTSMGFRGGAVVPEGDSAWAIYIVGRSQLVTVNDSGRELRAKSVQPSRWFLSAAAGDGHFAQLDLPPGKAFGDTVTAGVELVVPDKRMLARVPMRAKAIAGADLQPLSPFFAPRELWAIAPTYEVVVNQQSLYVLDWYDVDGQVRSVHVKGRTQRVTEADLDAEGAKFMARVPRSGRMFEAVQQDVARRQAGAPDYFQVIEELRFSRFGQLLVRTREDAETGEVRWDVFTAQGNLLGFLQMGEGERLLALEPDRALISRRSIGEGNRVYWAKLMPSIAPPTT